MTEIEFIQSEQAKCNSRLCRQLRKVDATGWAGRETIEMLLINDLIQFGGPRPEINHPYNCYRLTDQGGITDIQPRVNILTFHAWKAKGRSVKKGEHGVKVVTFIVCGDKEPDENGVIGTYRKPHTTAVFHISQTEDETEREARRLEAKRNRPVSLEATF